MTIAEKPTPIERSKFDIDLSAGEAWEQAFLGLIANAKIECKRERKARTTGNVFVEYHCRGHPSGLSVTEATWWAIGIEGPTGDIETAILASVPWLKDVCRPLLGTARDVAGGDDGLARGILLKMRDFAQSAAGTHPEAMPSAAGAS